MAQNPYMKVFVANGYYDLATPFAALVSAFDRLWYGLDVAPLRASKKEPLPRRICGLSSGRLSPAADGCEARGGDRRRHGS